nr:unnamed protein product [Callosobruchus analis]
MILIFGGLGEEVKFTKFYIIIVAHFIFDFFFWCFRFFLGLAFYESCAFLICYKRPYSHLKFARVYLSCQIFLSFRTTLLLLRINNNADKTSFWLICFNIMFRCISIFFYSTQQHISKLPVLTSFTVEDKKSLLKRYVPDF